MKIFPGWWNHIAMRLSMELCNAGDVGNGLIYMLFAGASIAEVIFVLSAAIHILGVIPRL